MSDGNREPFSLESLEPDYLDGVLANMNENSTVRFGMIGIGDRRNYQIRKVTESAYRKNHQRYSRRDSSVEEFEDKNLSLSFTYEELRAWLERPRS